jgi:hypothetical protein
MFDGSSEEILKILGAFLSNKKKLFKVIYLVCASIFLALLNAYDFLPKYKTFIDVLVTLILVHIYNLLFRSKRPQIVSLLNRSDDYINRLGKRYSIPGFENLERDKKIKKIHNWRIISYIEKKGTLLLFLLSGLAILIYFSWNEPDERNKRIIKDFYSYIDKYVVSKDGSYSTNPDKLEYNKNAWNYFSEKKKLEVSTLYPYHTFPAQFDELYRNTESHTIDRIKNHSANAYIIIVYSKEYIPKFDLNLIIKEKDESKQADMVIAQLLIYFQLRSFNKELNTLNEQEFKAKINSYILQNDFLKNLRDGTLWDLAKLFRLRTVNDIKLCQLNGVQLNESLQRRGVLVDPITKTLTFVDTKDLGAAPIK